MSNRVPQMLTDYQMYLEGGRQIGTVDVALPNIQMVTQTIQGAGIGGVSDMPVLGHTQDMVMTVNFRVAVSDLNKLLVQQYQNIEFWGAIQHLNAGTGKLEVAKHLVVVKAQCKGDNLGTMNPGELQGRSLEFNVIYIKEEVDGVLQREFDKFNFKHIVGGEDFLSSVRSAIGL